MIKGSWFGDSNSNDIFVLGNKMEKICVAVRVRPPTPESSSSENGSSLWKVEDNRISLHKSLDTPISTASYAFGTKSFSIHLFWVSISTYLGTFKISSL